MGTPTQTTPAPTKATRTLTGNLIDKLNEIDGDESLQLELLSLFEGLPAADLPIAELTDFLLTPDTNGDLFLVMSAQGEIWDRVSEIVQEDPERIPAEPVIAALHHALEVVSDTDEDADIDLDDCLDRLVSFATMLATFPEDVLAALLAHPRACWRLAGVYTLYMIDREAEIAPFATDPDAEVRASALRKAWKFIPLATMQQLAASDPDEDVRGAAAQCVEWVAKYGQELPA